MRQRTLDTFQAYLRRHIGVHRQPRIIVETASIPKEGVFAELEGWIHTLNGIRGLHGALP